MTGADAEEAYAGFPAFGQPVVDLGAWIVGAVVDWDAWVHRKVESIDLMPNQAARRRVSFDCTPPEVTWQGVSAPEGGSPDEILVPLTYMAKAPLQSLDVRDGAGVAVPILGRDSNALVAASAVAFIVWASTGKDLAELAKYRDRVLTIASEPPGVAVPAATTLVADLKLDVVAEALLVELAKNFLLTAVLRKADAERRQVLKFTYHWEVQEEVGQQNRWRLLRGMLAAGFGFTAYPIEVELGATFATRSYHLECAVPDGLVAGALRLPTDKSGVQPVAAPASRVLHAQGTYARDAVGPGFAALGFWLDRNGLLPRVLWSAVGTALIYAGLLFLPGAYDHLSSSVDAATTLLLFVPAIVVALNARQPENQIVARVLLPLRVTAIALAVVLYGAGAVLVFGLGEPATLTSWWVGWGLSLIVVAVTAAGSITLRVRRRV